jgi:large subunit ribosomal protein L30
MPAEDSVLGEKKPKAPRKPDVRMKASVKERRRQESPSDHNDTFSPKSETQKPRARRATKIQEIQEKVQEKEILKHEKPKERLFAVVRIRGTVGVRKEVTDTLMMLRLHRINHCVIIPKNQNYDGMLHKARDFITWGEIDKETLEKLISKRGRFAGDKRVKDLSYAKELAQFILSGKRVKETGIKPVFRLSPPSKGYKSTKALFPRGSLGYRGEKINELIKRMI